MLEARPQQTAAGIPRIIYGTAWKGADTEELVRLAIEQGFRGIDTACQPKHYNESGVGAALAACLAGGVSRNDLYLQTKFTTVSGQDPGRIPYDPRAPLERQLAQSLAASLRNLQTDYLDCLVLHSPLPSEAQTLRAWRAMEALVSAGGIRRLGISNCYRLAEFRRLYDAAEIKPAVLQNRFYSESGYDRELREFCRETQIVYQSFWTLTANPHLLRDATIVALASLYQRTPAQVLFRYLTQEGVVPLTGTRSIEAHARGSSIFGFDLTSAQRVSISRLL